MVNWYNDGVCLPVYDRLDKIALLCQDNSEVQILIEEITTVLESAGTECPDHKRDSETQGVQS